jgi:hypothetical protein
VRSIPESCGLNDEFNGFEVRAGEHITVTRAPNFASNTTIWLSPGNHNHLRITRILRCLTLLGLDAEARAFLDCLYEVYEHEQNKPMPAISYETMLYWREAVDVKRRKIWCPK